MAVKQTAVALAVLACFAGAAQADIVTFTGDTTGGPTYNRLLEDLSDLSLTGTDVAYSTYTFTVDTAGTYTFLSTAMFDNFTFLYVDAFDAAMPMMGAEAGNDDLLTTTTSGFAADLLAGTTYVYVTTGFSNSDAGTFAAQIGGPGVITAVPEPETYALMLGGLAAIGWLVGRRRA